MKQAFFIFIIFCAFIFIVKFFPVDFSTKISPELFVGQDAVFFSSHKNLSERLKNFRLGKLGGKIQGIDFPNIAKGLEIPEKDISEITNIIGNIVDTFNHPIVNELLEKEITIALYPLDQSSNKKIEDDLLDSILLVSRTRYHKKIIGFLSDMVVGKERTESVYGGYTIRKYPVANDRVIAVSMVKDLLLLAYNERLLRKSLDIYDADYPKLADLDAFQKAVIEFKSASSVTYINTEKLRNNLVSILKSSYLHQRELFISELEKFNGYKNVFWGIWSEKNEVRQKITVSLNLEDIDLQYRNLFTVIPEKTYSYKKLSQDTIWYYWTNIFRPKTLLKLLDDKRRSSNKSNLIDTVTQVAGTTREELIELIESDFFVAVKDISDYQFVPFPPILTAVKVKDTEKIKKIINELVKYYDLPITSKKNNGIEISYWGETGRFGDIQPTYAIVDGYLVFSSNGKQIKEFTSNLHDNSGLDMNDSFKKVDIGFTVENNSINFLNFAKVVKLSQELVSWGGTMIAIIDRDTARKTKILIDNLINPVLDGLTMYSTMGIRSYLDKENLIIESKTIVDYRDN